MLKTLVFYYYKFSSNVVANLKIRLSVGSMPSLSKTSQMEQSIHSVQAIPAPEQVPFFVIFLRFLMYINLSFIQLVLFCKKQLILLSFIRVFIKRPLKFIWLVPCKQANDVRP
jgi:hypothetical protein